MRHFITHKSRGFGFITFRSRAEATRAQKEMQGFKLLKSNMKVYLKEQYDNLDPQSNLVISDFPEDFSEADLIALGEKYGPVFSVKISPSEENEGNNGLKAYIQFETVEVAKKAAQELNGSDLKGQKISAEQTGKKNKIYIKAEYSENVVNQLKLALDAWKPLDLGNIDVSEDKLLCILQIKFEDELQTKAFLQDFHGDKSKCFLNRPCNQRSLRTLPFKILEKKL